MMMLNCVDFRRFERILLDAYLWLSENYEDGDRIFLFGNSYGMQRPLA